MIERPILFKDEMVRAILDGRKTQTRRLAKEFDGKDVDGILKRFPRQKGCRLGEIGDRLWVRETWAVSTKGADALYGTHWNAPWYRADADAYGLLGHDGDGAVYSECLAWRPSIHMKREHSRINLEITDVMVERLNDISDEDAFAEGIDEAAAMTMGCTHDAARAVFSQLWESINGPGSWDKNPWVWAITFRRVE